MQQETKCARKQEHTPPRIVVVLRTGSRTSEDEHHLRFHCRQGLCDRGVSGDNGGGSSRRSKRGLGWLGLGHSGLDDLRSMHRRHFRKNHRFAGRLGLLHHGLGLDGLGLDRLCGRGDGLLGGLDGLRCGLRGSYGSSCLCRRGLSRRRG